MNTAFLDHRLNHDDDLRELRLGSGLFRATRVQEVLGYPITESRIVAKGWLKHRSGRSYVRGLLRIGLDMLYRLA